MTAEELKPCPFCGDTKPRKTGGVFHNGNVERIIECGGFCGASVRMYKEKEPYQKFASQSYESAIAAWNARPAEARLREAITAARDEIAGHLSGHESSDLMKAYTILDAALAAFEAAK